MELSTLLRFFIFNFQVVGWTSFCVYFVFIMKNIFKWQGSRVWICELYKTNIECILFTRIVAECNHLLKYGFFNFTWLFLTKWNSPDFILWGLYSRQCIQYLYRMYVKSYRLIAVYTMYSKNLSTPVAVVLLRVPCHTLSWFKGSKHTISFNCFEIPIFCFEKTK